MRLSLFVFLMLTTTSCSLYKSAGRKFLEQQGLNYLHDLVVVASDCSAAPMMEAPAELEEINLSNEDLKAWREHLPTNNMGRYFISSKNRTCEFVLEEPLPDPLDLALVELYYISSHEARP